MKKTVIRINGFLKGIVLVSRPHIYLGWLGSFLFKFSNTLKLTKWIASQNKKEGLNDFYTPIRDYSKRYHLYQYVIDKFNLENDVIIYVEFGVSGGHSFKWWLDKCKNVENKFYGFDTFEGLPENWGTFIKGDMAAGIPLLNDGRAEFIKGLFQDTIHEFLSRNSLKSTNRKIIHLDADLFSSTLLTLTSIAPFLNKGDILIFDEFNVPDHEFLAYKIFIDSYYKKTKLIGAVNNYLQVAMIVL